MDEKDNKEEPQVTETDVVTEGDDETPLQGSALSTTPSAWRGEAVKPMP